ncbi:MAG: Ig domain-containing protein, partial [Lachnospiraceae bacterium]|nr:Ig domain-containing protein [Lachnospiraceae bacterium]
MQTKSKKILAIMLVIMFVITNLSTQPMSVEAATPKPTTIKLNATQKELYVGQKYTLKVKTVKPSKASKAVTWKSSNKKVATVNSKGKVTAKKAGTAKITATSKANKKVKAVCKITVCNKATKITLNRTEKNMSVGEEFVLKVKTVKPAKASKEVTWKSSDKKVATVSNA